MIDIRDRAYTIARHAHHGQVDKAGQDYLYAHLFDVVLRLQPDDTDAIVVAWLHDVLEDTDVTEHRLRLEFAPDLVDAVVAITHRRDESRDDYYARVRADPLALRVKLADIASNTDPARIALLDEPTRARLTAKYAHALEVLA